MLIPMQKSIFHFNHYFKNNGNGNGDGNVNGNSNGNDYLNQAFLAQNGEGTVQERSEKNWLR